MPRVEPLHLAAGLLGEGIRPGLGMKAQRLAAPSRWNGGISGLYVTRLLDRAATFRGYPLAVRTDNGPEFTSRAFMA